MHKIAVLPGDGIGKEVTEAAIPVFVALNIPVNLEFGDIGWEFWKHEGNPIPERTWSIIKAADATLLGAITSKPEREALSELSPDLIAAGCAYVSPVIQLRQKLDLFANIRPVFNVVDDKKFRCCVIRENTEGLYSGFDYYPLPEELKKVIKQNKNWQQKVNEKVSCSLRLQSYSGLLRLFKFAFNYAKVNGYKRVTFADKPNVLRKSSAFAREVFESIAEQYSEIQSDILNVDAVALWLVRKTEDFGVVVAENMFGDILSDLSAGMMGGLGFAPSANVGAKGCYFEPVHGSAPKIKSGCANPSAMFLTIGLLLEHLGYTKQANIIKNAVKAVIKNDRYVTYDLGGKASTKDMANAIIDSCCCPIIQKRTSFLVTGNEIVNGEVVDTNSAEFAKIIAEHGGNVYQRIHVSDRCGEIENAFRYLLNKSDAIIVTGGLGPTIDDCTRDAIANGSKGKLVFSEEAWEHVSKRLTRFNLEITEANRRQAYFPEGYELIPNQNGTALGCHFVIEEKHFFMLPGPPKESQPMFIEYVLPVLNKNNFFAAKRTYRWLTLGLIEGEIAPKVDALVKTVVSAETSYRWFYPYIEIKFTTDNNIDAEEACSQITTLLENNLVSVNGMIASELLKAELHAIDFQIFVSDPVTAGAFIAGLPNISLIRSVDDLKDAPPQQIAFFTEWEKNSNDKLVCQGSVIMTCKGFVNYKCQFTHDISIPNRGDEVLLFGREYLSWQLYLFIQFCKKNFL